MSRALAENWSERADSYNGRWKIVMINPMSFQDRDTLTIFATMADSRTPVATQEGEISFSAYNERRLAKVSSSTCIKLPRSQNGTGRMLGIRSMQTTSE